MQITPRRVIKMMSSRTLEEATKMGPMDKLSDFFHSAHKKELLEDLYGPSHSHSNMDKFIRFVKIRNASRNKNDYTVHIEKLN